MKDLSYTDFFGKKVSHNDALITSLSDKLVNILREERKISEKDFSNCDLVIKTVKKIISKNIDIFLKRANTYINENKRIQLLAEEIYDEYFDTYKYLSLTESIKKFGDFT